MVEKSSVDTLFDLLLETPVSGFVSSGGLINDLEKFQDFFEKFYPFHIQAQAKDIKDLTYTTARDKLRNACIKTLNSKSNKISEPFRKVIINSPLSEQMKEFIGGELFKG